MEVGELPPHNGGGPRRQPQVFLFHLGFFLSLELGIGIVVSTRRSGVMANSSVNPGPGASIDRCPKSRDKTVPHVPTTRAHKTPGII